ERDRFAGFVEQTISELPPEQLLPECARFTGPTTLRTDQGTEVEASAVVIATGSSPFIPPPFRALEGYMVNDDVFEMTDLPESLAVVGTGIIGLELGQAMHRLGVRTTLFDIADAPGPLTDPTLRKKAVEVFEDDLDLYLSAELLEVQPVASGFMMRWKDKTGAEREDTFEKLLIAAGRTPNIEDLGLEHTGVPLDERGLPASNLRTLQLGDQPIFIAGDASGHRPLLHEAADEGRIAGYNAARFPHVDGAVRRAQLAVAFTGPQIGIAGQSFKDLNPEEIVVGEVSYDDQGRARVMGVHKGLVRVYARRRDCVLVGAEMLGPRVEHTAHLLAWVIQQNMRVQEVLRMPFYHPVLEEGIRTALRDAAQKLQVVGHCPPEDFAFGPGC
ncbi:MAG: dihydrolipoyl dehydrogenase, partial [Myxococcota bacterium]